VSLAFESVHSERLLISPGGPQNSTIVPNRTFIPMFCYRLKGGLADIVRLMKKGRPEVDPTKPLEDGAYSNDEFIIEEKLDGERIQLHKVGDQYKYWSR